MQHGDSMDMVFGLLDELAPDEDCKSIPGQVGRGEQQKSGPRNSGRPLCSPRQRLRDAQQTELQSRTAEHIASNLATKPMQEIRRILDILDKAVATHDVAACE